MKRTAVFLFCVLVLVLAACGKDNVVGDEKLLDIEAQAEKCRLGQECPTPTPAGGGDAKGAIGAAATTTTVASPPPPAEKEEFFDVTLVQDPPYFQPGNSLLMQSELTLRVTNKDTCTCRPKRTFEAKDGSFSSGFLVPNQSWTIRLGPGFWDIVDQSAGFIVGTLEVV